MKHLFVLAGVAACSLIGGCSEPGRAPTTAAASGDGVLELVADADFEAFIAANPVVVVNFTADW